MEFGFTEEQQMIRESVRRYAEAELLPHYKRWDRTGEWLTQTYIDKLVDTGLLHLATASGCRVITLENFGSTQCPYAHPDWSIKPQRRGQAIDTIDPNIILAEIRRVIAG